ncbi:MAG: ATP-binding cassette domain-containing protein [Actinomycetota bacterium]|nr:MAG: ATP-binding cassette domain-containing protein [Actinomycetota bacterium]
MFGAPVGTGQECGPVNCVALQPVAASRTQVQIEAKDVVLSFVEMPALLAASLSVRQEEIVAVMGPNGSGKPTVLQCLAGILVPDSGEVYFEGQRIDTHREQERSTLRSDH